MKDYGDINRSELVGFDATFRNTPAISLEGMPEMGPTYCKYGESNPDLCHDAITMHNII